MKLNWLVALIAKMDAAAEIASEAAEAAGTDSAKTRNGRTKTKARTKTDTS